jgi:hypothetical protein
VSESLWKSFEPPRFFIIPDNVAPPAGDLSIRNLIGERRSVDPASVTRYEVTEEQATEWMRGKVGNLLEGVRGWVDKAVDRLSNADADPVGALREAIDRVQHLVGKDLGSAEAAALNALADRLQDLASRLHAAAEGR